jgi:hypothetical protein
LDIGRCGADYAHGLVGVEMAAEFATVEGGFEGVADGCFGDGFDGLGCVAREQV